MRESRAGGGSKQGACEEKNITLLLIYRCARATASSRPPASLSIRPSFRTKPFPARRSPPFRRPQFRALSAGEARMQASRPSLRHSRLGSLACAALPSFMPVFDTFVVSRCSWYLRYVLLAFAGLRFSTSAQHRHKRIARAAIHWYAPHSLRYRAWLGGLETGGACSFGPYLVLSRRSPL